MNFLFPKHDRVEAKTVVEITRYHTPLHIMLQWIRNLLAMVGLLTVAALVFLFIQGHQVVHSFDEEFIDYFTKFISKLATEDVVSTLVIRTPLDKSVTVKQAIKSMKNYAKRLNIEFINHYPLTEQSEDFTSLTSADILEFCDPKTASALLNYNTDFAILMPCRIILYQDKQKKAWLTTLNLDLFIYGTHGIETQAKIQALKMQDNLIKIMGAGASGVVF